MKYAVGRISGKSSTSKPPPPPPAAPPNAKNVLFIIADDLRPQLAAAYGHSWMKTPNIDKFTSRSMVFLRAFVQQQVCSPSRNSFMTGRRPDATGVWNFNDDFRISRPTGDPEDTRPGRGADWTTLPQYFKQHGYQVYGTGKLFHPDRPMNNDLPKSWTEYAKNGHGQHNKTCNKGRVLLAKTKNASTEQGNLWQKILGCEENDDEALLTNAAIAYLHKAVGSNRPFFIGMGHRT